MPELPPRSQGSRRFYIERKNCPKINFLCGDLGFLDYTFSNNDPLDKLELKKIQKVTSEVISFSQCKIAETPGTSAATLAYPRVTLERV